MFEVSVQVDGPKYNVLEPILELLLENGNELATDYRWGSNPTGYFCVLKHSIDFELIERTFSLPSSIQVLRQFGSIDYGLGTVVIQTN